MQRPFYIIAHHVNNIASISRVITEGANAIECDIKHDGNQFIVLHGFPDVDSNPASGPTPDLVTYLQNMAALASNDNRLALVIFDVKDNGDPDLAVPLLETIRSNLTDQVSLYVLISVATYDDREFLRPLARYLRENEAVAIDSDNDPSRVSDFFQSVPFPGDQRHAYGNGITQLLPTNPAAPNVPPSVMEAVAQKALAPNRLGIRLVYVWTLDDQDSMRDYLRMGVDGIITNNVACLVAVVQEREFNTKVRLATRDDDPFAPSSLPAYVLTVRTGTETLAGTDAYLLFQLVGVSGTATTFINAYWTGLFEQGQTNRVTLIGQDVGVIQKLTISRNTARNAPGWFLWDVTVQSAGSRRPDHTFVFSQWIPSDEDHLQAGIVPLGVTRWVSKRDDLLREFATRHNFGVTDPLTHDEVKILAHEWLPEIRFHENENFHSISLGEFLGLRNRPVRHEDYLKVITSDPHFTHGEKPPVFFASHDWKASVGSEGPEVTSRSYMSNVSEVSDDISRYDQRDRSPWGLTQEYFGSSTQSGVKIPRFSPITAIAEYRDLRQTLRYRVLAQIEAKNGSFPIDDDGQLLDAIIGPPLLRAKTGRHLNWLLQLLNYADQEEQGDARAADFVAAILRELEADEVITQSEWKVIRDFAFLEYYFFFAYNDITKHFTNPFVRGDHEGDVECFVAAFDRNEVAKIRQETDRINFLQQKLKPHFVLASGHAPWQQYDTCIDVSRLVGVNVEQLKIGLKVWVMPGSHATVLKPGKYDLLGSREDNIKEGIGFATFLGGGLWLPAAALLILLVEHFLLPEEETSDNGVHALPPRTSTPPSTDPTIVQSRVLTTPLSRDRNIYQVLWQPGAPTEIDATLAERSFPGAWGFDSDWPWINKTERFIQKLAHDYFET